MKVNRRVSYGDMDIKVQIGNALINILEMAYQPPDPGWGADSHCHSGYELHFIPEGRGILRVYNETYDITPGTFFITGPEVYHEQKPCKDDPMSELCINLELKVLKRKHLKSAIYARSEVDEMLSVLQNTSFWFGKDQFSSFDILKKIILEFENKNIGYFTNIQNLFSEIIVNTVRNCTHQKEVTYDTPRKISHDMRRIVIDGYFCDYSQHRTVEELAKILDISIRQLERITHHYFSMSFKEKLISTRLIHAKEFLSNTNMTIEEIANKVGFCGSGYFCRAFKKYEKVTPSEYRKNKKA